MINAFIIAFAMYSKIPMPRADWNEKNMKYVMAVFPWVGAVVGLVLVGAWYLMDLLAFGEMFRTAVLTAIPVLITGGIHMDGFMDTMDARSSWGDREKKLEILKDSHTGAFAILGCCMYFVISLGVWNEMLQPTPDAIVMAAFAFFISRCLSGLGITLFQCAKNSGLAHTFHSAAQKTTVRNALVIQLVLCCILMIALHPAFAIPEILVGLAVFGYYRWFSYKEFGGINGDMAGFFMSVAELLMVMAVAVTARVLAL